LIPVASFKLAVWKSAMHDRILLFYVLDTAVSVRYLSA